MQDNICCHGAAGLNRSQSGNFRCASFLSLKDINQKQLNTLSMNSHGGSLDTNSLSVECLFVLLSSQLKHSDISFPSLFPSTFHSTECFWTGAACSSPPVSSGYWGAVRSGGSPGNCGRGHEVPWARALASGHGRVVQTILACAGKVIHPQ